MLLQKLTKYINIPYSLSCHRSNKPKLCINLFHLCILYSFCSINLVNIHYAPNYSDLHVLLKTSKIVLYLINSSNLILEYNIIYMAQFTSLIII